MTAHPSLASSSASKAPSRPTGWWRRTRITDRAGFILGIHWNVEDADQVRRLTTSLQALAQPGLPFLICADEEGGQLSAFTGITTPFPGAMALGAAGDADLARRVAAVSGEELAALGVNVVLAPVVDVVTRPDNPSLGIRGFGDDPSLVARMGTAMVDGYRDAGIAATAKHFPGKGEAVVDPHDDAAGARPRRRPARCGRVRPVPRRRRRRGRPADDRPLLGAGAHRRPGHPDLGEPGPA